jgi:hypothetical protein
MAHELEKKQNNDTQDKSSDEVGRGKKNLSLKIIEERDKPYKFGLPPNFIERNACFEYSEASGKLNPAKKLKNRNK